MGVGVGVGVLVALVAAACSGGGGDEAESGPTSSTLFGPPISAPPGTPIREGEAACALLSRSDVAAILDRAVDSGHGSRSEDGSSACRWNVSGTDGGVAVARGPGSEQALTGERNRSEGEIAVLSGIGDRGFISDAGAYVLSGDTLVAVFIDVDQPPAERRATATELIRTAVQRL